MSEKASPPETTPLAPLPVKAEGSQPEIRVAYRSVGRETLAAINAELLPTALPAEPESSSPEISVGKGFAGRETLAAILEEARPAPLAPLLGDSPATAEIFEMATFVVRGVEAARLSSDGLRRRFVAENLLQRLPARSMEDVDRVDVTPWTVQGTLVVRVWCRIPPRP